MPKIQVMALLWALCTFAAPSVRCPAAAPGRSGSPTDRAATGEAPGDTLSKPVHSDRVEPHGGADEQKTPETGAKPGVDVQAERERALREGWPDTPAGWVASAWVRAFAAGDEAMTLFLSAHIPEERMAERSLEERMKSYLRLRERLGTLILGSVAESKPAELTAVLLAEDASPHRFVFTVETEAPHRLVKIAMLHEGRGHGHGRGGH